VLKKHPSHTLLFFLFSFSSFHFQLDMLWLKFPAIFQGKKVHLIVVFFIIFLLFITHNSGKTLL